MEFASIFNIWFFLPISIILYYVIFLLCKNKRTKILNGFLLIISLLFYCWGGISNLIKILAIITTTYYLAIWMDLFDGEDNIFVKSRKGIFVFSIIINVLTLAFFKYFNMVVKIFEILFIQQHKSLMDFFVHLCRFEGTGTIDVPTIVMPLAISFIEFQLISYLTDVYKKKHKAENNFVNFALYNLLFVKLVQGPIMTYEQLSKQIYSREHSVDKFSLGIKRFSYGLAKKVIIANTLAEAVNRIWICDIKEIGTIGAWVGLILYTLEIYYDFSGYSDMAVGIGNMFGFDIIENFNYPYMSLSIQEFWRRWHTSLSTWFKNYIYIPLGGNRKGLPRTLVNIFIVFLITGIWHGANLTYVFWGLYFAFFNIIERLFLGQLLKRNKFKILNWIYTMFVIMIGWVFFNSYNLIYAAKYIKYLFVYIEPQGDLTILSFINGKIIFSSLIGVVLCGPIQAITKSLANRIKENKIYYILDVVLQIVLFVISIVLIISGSYNPSIYTKF